MRCVRLSGRGTLPRLASSRVAGWWSTRFPIRFARPFAADSGFPQVAGLKRNFTETSQSPAAARFARFTWPMSSIRRNTFNRTRPACRFHR